VRSSSADPLAVAGFQTPAVSRAFHAVPAPPASPTGSNQIQNIDQLRTAIKAYYGDTLSTDVDPVPNAVDNLDNALHYASPTSAYAKEVARIEKSAAGYPKKAHGSHKAILLDVDDTSLSTYDYEIYSTSPTTRRPTPRSSTARRSRPCSGCRASRRRPRPPATRCSSSPVAPRASVPAPRGT
jgi:hypothetical protein